MNNFDFSQQLQTEVSSDSLIEITRRARDVCTSVVRFLSGEMADDFAVILFYSFYLLFPICFACSLLIDLTRREEIKENGYCLLYAHYLFCYLTVVNE